MSKDLFDDTTMSFGEHLEALRTHLIKALLGLILGVILALFFSNYVIYAMEVPVDRALAHYYGTKSTTTVNDQLQQITWWQWLTGSRPATTVPSESDPALPPPEPSVKPAAPTIVAQVDVNDIIRRLNELDSKAFPLPAANAKPRWIDVRIPSSEVQEALPATAAGPGKLTATTFGPEEAFMIYIKVAMVTGLVLSSPWIFFQLWLFVAAGLYPHERKYVHIYLPMSIGLFLGGALFCFFVVIPYVLDFLFSFNAWLNIMPQIRITEWISFAVILPVMFGVSFQLPLVMLFLERISIFDATVYREKRRISILVISIISMVLTPSDPVSMMLMLVPLCLLYEFGILLCAWQQPKSPFEAEAVA